MYSGNGTCSPANNSECTRINLQVGNKPEILIGNNTGTKIQFLDGIVSLCMSGVMTSFFPMIFDCGSSELLIRLEKKGRFNLI
jgi:hypothetical protein